MDRMCIWLVDHNPSPELQPRLWIHCHRSLLHQRDSEVIHQSGQAVAHNAPSHATNTTTGVCAFSRKCTRTKKKNDVVTKNHRE
mmetsp:Transcript_18309/g.52275  ORF Transcript_18309/g.52275 Transcript_18309/m.52275 type:complete len:84 (+) Transcript_18309:108-359(+)